MMRKKKITCDIPGMKKIYKNDPRQTFLQITTYYND
jgi:hypothetical protein